MCGRYASTRSAADLSALFEALDETTDLAPRYNLAPTDPAPVVRVSREQGARVLDVGRWGLLPHWARDQKAAARMINARAETVATAPAFARAFATRRALVPADGWYEWRRLDGGGKQAYFMTPQDGSVLGLAGLWSRWGPDRLLTFSIVTTAAVGDLGMVHDRMPLVLPPERWQSWLAGEPDLTAPSPELAAGLELRPVDPAVGNVRNDGPQLVARVPDPDPSERSMPTLF
jgi:putative SOS response-associated peptidase YedK